MTERLHFRDFPGGSDSKESACSARDLDPGPGLGRSPGGRRQGNPTRVQERGEQTGFFKLLRNNRVTDISQALLLIGLAV